ncbi:unnamed protein product [Trifolium pratense]|uniref:Uncharacterized protein n=1 Tax=Trifolium pratense TaxID=57577 RepID=A0ACB0JPU1_TRIPR|nr:unnamed protein product [Trifolium pratense]
MANIAASGIVHEPLTKDNYDNWSCLVRNYLLGHGLWGIVISNAEMGVGSKEEIEIWEMKNAKALHIIQLACGSENLADIKDLHTAKEAWNNFSTSYSSELKAESDIEQGVVDDTLHGNRLLHRNIESGEWSNAKAIMINDETGMAMFSTSTSGRTILHVAVIAGHKEIVKNLLKLKRKDELVKMQDNRGYTALALVAELSGNTDIAKCMVEMKGGKLIGQDLLSMKNNDGEIPILLAAAKGHKEMTSYLFTKTELKDMTHDNFHNGVLLLTRCINAEIFDVALSLLQLFPDLPLAHKSKSDGVQPLYALARMSSMFRSGSRYGLIQQFLYKILREKKVQLPGIAVTVTKVAQQEKQPKTSFTGRIFGWMLNILKISQVQLLRRLLMHVYMKFQDLVILNLSGIREIYDKKRTHRLVRDILNCLSQRIQKFKESELREASAYDAMLQAAKHGNIEFINAMRNANPDLLWAAIDKNKRDIFSHAILNRRKVVFQLIHDETVNGRKEIVRCRVDAFGNSLLHLAGKLGPLSDLHRRSGPALQMQRELLWFKEVEKLVHPKCKEAKNAEGKKPRHIFTENHKELVKAGEKWAKHTAGSFTLVATLITTIMFAAAFTVPDAISLFTSSTAVLLFIGILTARYAENDFLKSLPLKLLFGLIALFFSVVSMMVAFCASLAMLLKGHEGIIITAMSFACIPVIVLLPSQLRLFIEIFKSMVLSN